MTKFQATVLMDLTVTADSQELASEKWEHVKKHGFYKMDVLALPAIKDLNPSWAPVVEMED